MEDIAVVKLRNLVEAFQFVQICGDERSLERNITIADTNRPGLELAGFFQKSQLKRLIILGDKEISYIKTMSEEKQRESFGFLTSEVTPAIIITKNHSCPEVLKEVAEAKNFPVFSSSSPTYRLIIDIVTFLDEHLSENTNLHGGLLNIYGKGVLIRGDSGLGKSEIALELIKRGHILIADDRVDCYRIHNSIIGKAPELLRDMLELRGVGVINVARMFGVSSVAEKTKIDFQVTLEQWDRNREYDRVGIEERKYEDILGIKIPKIVVPIREGRSMAVVIETAVTNFMLSEMGLNSAKEFEQRVLDYIKRNS
ncbi:MAG: HPr(Ser) kinase/phosphatase [Longicatena sp.]|nr:HPr(Ser) kinase/phosphatase [Longicatena sp.]